LPLLSLDKETGLSAVFKYDYSIINELKEMGGFDPDSITLNSTSIPRWFNVISLKCAQWELSSNHNFIESRLIGKLSHLIHTFDWKHSNIGHFLIHLIVKTWGVQKIPLYCIFTTSHCEHNIVNAVAYFISIKKEQGKVALSSNI
jgi:hypothetical protein